MLPNSLSHIIRFSTFEVNLKTGELRQDGQKVRLQEQPFRVLATLLERPGEVVTREELRSKLWPADTFVDFDHGLNAAIKRLRDALGESAETPIFIETLARRGYRFIAPVDDSFAPSARGGAVVPPRTIATFFRQWLAIALLSSVLIAVLVWAVWRHPFRRSEIIERKLTANSWENKITSATISPDGRYLAYADNTGVYLKLIRTGETHPVQLPPSFWAQVNGWFPDGSRLLITRQEQTKKPSLWSISVFGGPPHQMADDASGASLSLDGSYIAFVRGDLSFDGTSGRQLWVMRSNGTDVVEVAAAKSDGSRVGVPRWSADGKSIAYIRTDLPHVETSSIEVNEWQKRNARTVFANSHLMDGLYWLPDGRLVYSLREGQDSSVWTLPLQQYPYPRISGSSNRISQGPGWVHNLSGSLDGKVVTILRGNWGPSVFIGTLAVNGTHLLRNRRLTLDENESWADCWTEDSKAVLFSSDRNGTWEIFKQPIDEPSPEILGSSEEQLGQPRLTPDGSEVLYVSTDTTNISTPEFGRLEAPSSIFAIPINGGTPRLVLRDVAIWNVQCARSPSAVCMYSIRKGNTSSETFRFDVRTGKRIGPPQTEPLTSWSLSPDGLQRAIMSDSEEAKIQLRPTSTGKPRDVVVKGWKGISSIDWSADGKSLLVAWHNNNWESALLNVTLDGSASVLLKLRGAEVWYAIPSPDGRFVAISETTSPWNVWQIDNF